MKVRKSNGEPSISAKIQQAKRKKLLERSGGLAASWLPIPSSFFNCSLGMVIRIAGMHSSTINNQDYTNVELTLLSLTATSRDRFHLHQRHSEPGDPWDRDHEHYVPDRLVHLEPALRDRVLRRDPLRGQTSLHLCADGRRLRHPRRGHILIGHHEFRARVVSTSSWHFLQIKDFRRTRKQLKG